MAEEKMYCGPNYNGQMVCCRGMMIDDGEYVTKEGKTWHKVRNQQFIRTGDVPREKWQVIPGVFDMGGVL